MLRLTSRLSRFVRAGSSLVPTQVPAKVVPLDNVGAVPVHDQNGNYRYLPS